jgi:hypothetical protein
VIGNVHKLFEKEMRRKKGKLEIFDDYSSDSRSKIVKQLEDSSNQTC